jgi:hypothetical protein
MFKNLVKKIKGAAKKIAPYAGVVAGMFGASPLMAAGIGALGGGLGTGNMKGAVLGGLGGFGSGTMYGGQNRLFNTGLTNKMFGIGDPGTGGFFNPMNKGLGDLLMARSPDQVISPGSIIPGGTDGIPVDRFIPGETLKGETAMSRFKDALTMENNPLTGKALEKGSMYRYLPAALGGTALAYGLGAFDEEPIPEDEIPTEYVYNAATDPLKNVNKRFQDYYQGITQVAPSSIYGYLQSIGALKEGGIPRGYSGGGSMAQKMDVPGQFLLNDPSKSPLSVLEAADGMNTQSSSNIDDMIRFLEQGLVNDAYMREIIKNNKFTTDDSDEFREITIEDIYPGQRYNDVLKRMMTKGEMSTPAYKEDTPGISGLESYVDTGEGEGMDRGVGAAKNVLQAGAAEAMKELGTGNSSNSSDEGKTFGNGEFYYDDPKLIEFIQRRADSNGTTYQEELFKFVDEVEGFYKNKKADGGDLEILDQIEIVQGLMDKESDPLRQSFFADKIVELRKRVLDSYNSNANGGGLAAFDQGGQIMGPGTGREDIIPGKIVDKNTGQTSDMLVSNNEHIIPEYALYAMGGGDTKKGHDMMDALRKQTKPIAKDMGYNFKGAEDGSVMYG